MVAIVLNVVLSAMAAAFTWVVRALFLARQKKKSLSKADFEVVKELYEGSKLKDSHSYPLQLAFAALTGREQSSELAKMILSQENPLSLAKDFGEGATYLDEKRIPGSLVTVRFKKGLDSERIKKKSFWALARYFIFGFIGFAPVIFISSFLEVAEDPTVVLLVTVLWWFCLWIYAFLYLEKYDALKAAERVMEKFKKIDLTDEKKGLEDKGSSEANPEPNKLAEKDIKEKPNS